MFSSLSNDQTKFFVFDLYLNYECIECIFNYEFLYITSLEKKLLLLKKFNPNQLVSISVMCVLCWFHRKGAKERRFFLKMIKIMINKGIANSLKNYNIFGVSQKVLKQQ